MNTNKAIGAVVCAFLALFALTACEQPQSGAHKEALNRFAAHEEAKEKYDAHLMVRDFRAIEAALAVLERGPIRIEEYRRIGVFRFEPDIILVSFYQRDQVFSVNPRTGRLTGGRLGNSANPGETPDVEVRLSARDLKMISAGFSQ